MVNTTPNEATLRHEHDDDEILIGVSACVLGENVRYDGGHKHDRFVSEMLGAYVRYVPVCPEVDIGLGIPRETLRLVGSPEAPRMVAPGSGTDRTAKMQRYARRKVRELDQLALCGFIVQRGSPSCGMERVRVYPTVEGGTPERKGRGLFTAALLDALPHLPVEESGRLNDPRLRENFVERVFAFRRLRHMFRPRWTVGQLVAFHTREKLLLLAHHRPAYQQLGRLVAGAKKADRAELAAEYQKTFLDGMGRLATTRKHVNVLQHICGYFKKLLDEGDRAELREVIESYRRGEVPLVVPITLLRHHVRRCGIDYLAEQSYLDPHPRELMLRNHV